MANAPKKVRKGDGRVAFLAHADQFRKLLDAGHPQRSIYDDYGDKLSISYSQFNRYVGKYLLGRKTTNEHQKDGPVDPPAVPTEKASAAGSEGDKPIARSKRKLPFEFDGIPPPKEDLI